MEKLRKLLSQFVNGHRSEKRILPTADQDLITNETLDEEEILKVTGLPAASVLDSGKLTLAVA